MIVLDSLLWSGLRFVLDKVATAVDAEMNDEEGLRQALLEAGLRLEMGEITREEFAGLEAAILERLAAIRREREGDRDQDATRVTGVEVSVDAGAAAPAPRRRRRSR